MTQDEKDAQADSETVRLFYEQREPDEDAGGCMAILVSVCLAGALWLGAGIAFSLLRSVWK